MGRSRHPYKRITGSHARRERPAIDIGFKAIAKEPGVALVDLFETGNGRTGIDKCLGRERRWSFYEHCGPHVASPDWLSSGDSLWISKYNHNRVSFQTRLASCSEAPGRPGLDPGPLMPVEQRSGRDPVHSQVIRYSRNSND
jgi:hypothetical protein